MEILLEYLGEILIGLELILLKVLGKSKSAKEVAKADVDLAMINEIKKGG